MWAVLLTLALRADLALATPSSNLWGPSTALCQAYKTPHLTYDTYVRKGPGLTSGHPSAFANTYGLTVGVLPGDKIHAEVGWDMVLPSEDPHMVNAKICWVEPALSFGIYNVGFKKNVNNADILYLMYQRALPGDAGTIALGGYHGTNKLLFTNSDGEVKPDGLLFAVISPDIQLGFENFKKVNFLFDLQTGKNAYGAWALGTNLYFADHVSLAFGPVFFFDRRVQPNGADSLWAVELDADF